MPNIAESSDGSKLIEASCSVCIASYRRPQLLAKLLESLLRQQLDSGISMEIIVVDNDAAESAREVVEHFQNSQVPISYLVEEVKNISLARNKGIARASGDYIFFIDDDETADESWISTMLAALRAYPADGVVGRVISDFHPDTPEWMRDIFLFNRPAVATGQPTPNHSTANCVIKASILKTEADLFDERFGVTGGEDSHLFKRLERKGKHFIYSGESIVRETIPPERTREAWMLRRAYRTGNIYGRIRIELASNKALERFKNFGIGLGQALASLFLALINLPSAKKRWHWFLKACSNWGRMLSAFNIRIEGY
jgi:succinoglycan biosynthesis protein ExoM